MLVRLDFICCPCHLTQITYQKPRFAGCYNFFQYFFFFERGGGGGEKENPVQVKPGNNSEAESPNLSLPHPRGEKPKIHDRHRNRVLPDTPALLPPPGHAFCSRFASAAPLCLPAGPFIRRCHFVPFSEPASKRVYPRAEVAPGQDPTRRVLSTP